MSSAVSLRELAPSVMEGRGMGGSWGEADPWVRGASGDLEGREGVKK